MRQPRGSAISSNIAIKSDTGNEDLGNGILALPLLDGIFPEEFLPIEQVEFISQRYKITSQNLAPKSAGSGKRLHPHLFLSSLETSMEKQEQRRVTGQDINGWFIGSQKIQETKYILFCQPIFIIDGSYR